MIDPNNGNVIFDLTGASPEAAVTPGVNWVSGCSDPRFPDGRCPLGTPGLIDAIFSAWKALHRRFSNGIIPFSRPGLRSLKSHGALQSLFDPDYKTPYSIHLNLGVQRELRPGLVLSVDYLRILGLHSIMRRDWNRVGAADTLNIANARAAMDAVHGALGCPAGPAGVNCAIAAGANMEVLCGKRAGSGRGRQSFRSQSFCFSRPQS